MITTDHNQHLSATGEYVSFFLPSLLFPSPLLLSLLFLLPSFYPPLHLLSLSRLIFLTESSLRETRYFRHVFSFMLNGKLPAPSNPTKREAIEQEFAFFGIPIKMEPIIPPASSSPRPPTSETPSKHGNRANDSSCFTVPLSMSPFPCNQLKEIQVKKRR